MAPYNVQWENQIKVYRKNRRLLVARNIPFSASRDTFEASIRERLTAPDSVIFLWPPSASATYNNPRRHMGHMMLAFNDRADARRAETELQGHTCEGAPVMIDRASKTSYKPGHSSNQAITLDTTAAAATLVAPAIVTPETATTASSAINPSGLSLETSPFSQSTLQWESNETAGDDEDIKGISYED